MKRPDAPTVREALRGLRETLAAAGIESPDVEGDRLAALVLGIEPAGLALRASEPLTPRAAAELARLIARRTSGQPLQHLEGTVAFRDLVLRADDRALIPRPETEQLVELVDRELRGRATRSRAGVRTVPRPDARREAHPPAAVRDALDVGTGSGAIALSLVTEGIAGRVVALDLSPAALAQAAENRAAAGVSDSQVDLRQCGPDPFDALRPGETFDLVVSNPPYVRDDELDALPVEVREHEPRAALAGGADGLDLVRTIARRAPAHLAARGYLFLEIGSAQGRAALELFPASAGWTDARCRPDLSGRDRFVSARRA